MGEEGESGGKNRPNNAKVPGVPESEFEKLILTQAQVRRRNMLGSEISVDWNSYTGKATALGSELVSKVSSDGGGSMHPNMFNVGRNKDYPGDVFLESTVEPDESTIKARWTKDDRIHLNLERLLRVCPLAIPQGMKAFIAITRFESRNGPILHLHLTKPRFAEIGTKGTKKKSDEPQQTAEKQKGPEKQQGSDTPQGSAS